MRKDVGVDGDAQRISQLVWMFFLKIYDDRETELELVEDDYKSPIPKHLRWRNWAADKEGMTGDELADFVNMQLFPTLKEKLKATGVNAERVKVIRSVFEDAYNYMKSGTLMRQVINKINEIDFNSSADRQTFGNIYEQILKDLQSAGNAGEFYTPRAVTEFMVDRLAPQLKESVLDPACGTGGFLSNVIDYKRKNFVKSTRDEEALKKSIYGVEKKTLPHMLCTTNMILHGIDIPVNIKHDNTLSRPLRDYTASDRVDVIITNPPFGGMEEDGIENNFPTAFRTRETADLFLLLITHLLRNEGRAGVVLPDGFLFGEGTKTTLKRELLEEFNLHTIVRLPKGVFAPYTSIATNVLFFEKGEPTKEVWFFEHPYPEGYKSYSRSKPLDIKEFDLEKAWWGGRARKSRKVTEYAWKVSAADIAARNYNLDCKNPHAVEVTHRDPAELMAEYQDISRQLAQAQQALKAELLAALRGSA